MIDSQRLKKKKENEINLDVNLLELILIQRITMSILNLVKYTITLLNQLFVYVVEITQVILIQKSNNDK